MFQICHLLGGYVSSLEGLVFSWSLTHIQGVVYIVTMIILGPPPTVPPSEIGPCYELLKGNLWLIKGLIGP